MAGTVLTAEDRAQLLRMIRRQMNSHVHRRMNVGNRCERRTYAKRW
jgi:hypothetical protein